MSAYREFNCRACGAIVAWVPRTNGEGSYLAQPKEWRGTDNATARKTFYPAHECTPDPERAAQVAQEAAERVERATLAGRIVKGVRVVVVKGRKIEHGTTGTAFWVADEPNGYGVLKVGFTTDEGAKHFTNIANLEVAR